MPRGSWVQFPAERCCRAVFVALHIGTHRPVGYRPRLGGHRRRLAGHNTHGDLAGVATLALNGGHVDTKANSGETIDAKNS